MQSTITAEFTNDIETIWNVVTNNNSFQWRSDLQEILIHDENNFSEITKEGYRTDFEITSKKPFSYYAFNMKNKNMSGTWHGKFSIETGKTIIEIGRASCRERVCHDVLRSVVDVAVITYDV